MDGTTLLLASVGALILCWAVGNYANKKGRSFWGFFFLSVLFSPLIGFFIAFLVGENSEVVEERKVTSGDSKKCPYCAEIIKSEATVCRFCGKDVPVANTGKGGLDRNIRLDLEGYRSVGELEDYANKKGYSNAKYLLGKLYLDGELIEPDIETAKYWLQKAADENYNDAVTILKDL